MSKRRFHPFWLAVALIPACAPQTDEPDSQVLVLSTTEKVDANGGTVEIEAGSVTIPPGALVTGSSVSMQTVPPPSEFTSAALATASEPLEILAKGPDGKAIETVSTPMTVTLDLSAGASLALDDIETTSDNLCVFLKTPSAALYVWRRSALTVDETAAKVSLKSLSFGVFQVVYCGTKALPGFQEATPDVTGEPSLSLAMTIPSTQQDHRHANYCLALIRIDREIDDEIEATVVGHTDAAATLGKQQVLELSYGASSIVDGKDHLAMLFLNDKGVACPLTSGQSFDANLIFKTQVIYGFALDTTALAQGEVAGTLHADGPFKTETVNVRLSAPDPSKAHSPHVESGACFRLTRDGGMTFVTTSISSGGIDGSDEFAIASAVGTSSKKDDHELSVVLGEGCTSFRQEATTTINTTTARPYRVKFETSFLNASISKGAYLVPIRMYLTTAFKFTATNIGAGVGCLQVFPEGALNQKSGDPLGEVLLDLTKDSFDLWLPYRENAAGEAKYDLRITMLKSGAKDCDGERPPSMPGATNPVEMTKTLAKDIEI